MYAGNLPTLFEAITIGVKLFDQACVVCATKNKSNLSCFATTCSTLVFEEKHGDLVAKRGDFEILKTLTQTLRATLQIPRYKSCLKRRRLAK